MADSKMQTLVIFYIFVQKYKPSQYLYSDIINGSGHWNF